MIWIIDVIKQKYLTCLSLQCVTMVTYSLSLPMVEKQTNVQYILLWHIPAWLLKAIAL